MHLFGAKLPSAHWNKDDDEDAILLLSGILFLKAAILWPSGEPFALFPRAKSNENLDCRVS